MKILFLCGSLEPGKDGVGDYTRRLVGELIRQGHEISIIALNDKYIDAIFQTKQESGGTMIEIIRFPAILSDKERYRHAEKYINQYLPNWVSLQYVPYSYNKYGLAWSILMLHKKIKKQGIKFCVTVHEPFVRIDDSKNPIHVLIALLQKIILRKILRPSCFVMTSISHYGRLLNNNNKNIVINRIPPNIVPVFIPLEVRKIKKEKLLNQMNVSKLIMIFGDRNTDSVIAAIERINQDNQNKIGILIVGKVSKSNIDKHFIHYTGFLSEVDVSCHLQMADLFVLPERVYKNNRGGASFKSGALAAALATPLPVMSSLGDMTETPPLIHGENIWFTDFNNPKRLKNDILYLLNDPVLLDSIKLGARQLYKEYLNWEVITRKYSDNILSVEKSDK